MARRWDVVRSKEPSTLHPQPSTLTQVGTDHSPYVDQLLAHVQQLLGSLVAIGVPAAVQVHASLS